MFLFYLQIIIHICPTLVVRTFCVIINMELGLDKYTKTVLKTGKLVHGQKVMMRIS